MPKTSTSARQRSRRAKRKPRRPPAAPLPRAIEATLADIAHEIRTPLTGILALGELLATSELGERERGWATAIKSTAEHLALLTSLIIDAARADARGLVLRRELIRPSHLADALAASLAARAEAKGLDDEAHISGDLPAAVIGDPLRLRAALENLIDNAVKFTERGGVRLDVGSEPAGRGKVRLVFTVTDSGIGLTPVEIKRLFRPFAQANERVARRYGGAGLGLAFVKRVAKAMGGDLAVASGPGGGSRFRLTAVVDKVAGAATHGGAAPATAPPPRALTILCVEDNPYGRVVLNTILTELGHRADFVGTGEAAVETVARGGYDAVLMDVTLPGIDGLEATRRIRAIDGAAGRVPIVGISGRAKADNEAAGRAAGMDGYLIKPLSPSALTQVLGALAGRGDGRA
jgi:two-component system, sensor histidine kinase